MAALGAGLIVLAILIVLGRAFVVADPRKMVRAVRYSVGILLIGVGALLALAERLGLGLLLMSLGASAIATGRIGPFDLGGSSRSAGSTSAVRSRYFEMTLDHDSGGLDGRVVAGKNAGRTLDELDEAALREMAAEVAGDPQSLALLEAYLDRRIPGWREDGKADDAAGTGSAPDAGPMTDKKAYEVLGLLPGASEAEIRAAHRRLMAKFHPDVEGSSYIAAEINQAKDWLLGKHR
jgi:hypothetical protein